VIYKAKVGQASYGEAIGILLLDASNPFIPGDVANATTYDFPVRFQKVKGFSVERALGKDPTIFNGLLAAARELESQGVRAITGDCGFMGLHQRELAGQLTVPVFLSSLLQIPFILSIMAPDAKLGIITADSRSLDNIVLEAMGIPLSDHLKIIGLQDETYFKKGILDEVGILDTEKLEKEVPGISAKVRFYNAPEIGISSTIIRNRIKQGLPFRYLVPEKVFSIIEENKLYR